MTYNLNRVSRCSWIEYTRTASQSISTGSIITFDNRRSTGGDSVSIDSSTGVISLNSSMRYWIQASICIDRSTNDDFEINFEQSDGTALAESDGNFPAYNELVSGIPGYPYYNSSFLASLMVNSPSIDYRLKVTSCPYNSTLLVETHLFIMELE